MCVYVYCVCLGVLLGKDLSLSVSGNWVTNLTTQQQKAVGMSLCVYPFLCMCVFVVNSKDPVLTCDTCLNDLDLSAALMNLYLKPSFLFSIHTSRIICQFVMLLGLVSLSYKLFYM